MVLLASPFPVISASPAFLAEKYKAESYLHRQIPPARDIRGFRLSPVQLDFYLFFTLFCVLVATLAGCATSFDSLLVPRDYVA